MGRIAKAFALFLTLTIAMSCLPLLTVKPAHAMPNVHLDYTKTTITLQETVNFTAQVSYQANITWYLDDMNVKSEINTQSNFTFIPKTTGVYFVKLSVEGFTNPPPIEAIEIRVLESVSDSESPFEFVTPWVWENHQNLL